jgi:hypothetical protein
VFVATYGDDEPRRLYNKIVRPQSFPARYQVAVYGLLPEPSPPVISQSRDDVQLVRAVTAGTASIDPARCVPGDAQTLDCTAELGRISGAPSLERVIVPAGYTFPGCELLRVTTAAKPAALGGALGIGFYAAEMTAGQLSTNAGRLVPTGELKRVGDAVLKNGQPAVLHQFTALVNCEVAAGTSAAKVLKPFIDFQGGPPPTIYRNWDPIAENYTLGGTVTQLERGPEVLR